MNRRHCIPFLLMFAMLVLFGGAPLHADILVGAPGDPGVGDCVPFGCSIASVFQQIFDASLFSGPTGPITIAGLKFFLNNFDNVDPIFGTPIVPDTVFPANYTIQFSTVSIPVDGLDPALENNVAASTVQTFFAGAVSDPVNHQITVITSPANYFTYDPSSGNLLIQILTDGDPADQSITMYLDQNSTAGGLFSSGFDSDPHPCPGGSPDGTGCTNADFGLVVDFLTPTDVNPVPEPGAIWLLATACAGAALAASKRLRRTQSNP